MAGAGIGNPLGAVVALDGESPRIIGGYVRNEIISGGVFVFASGAASVVTSGLSSFATANVLFTRDASGAQFNGINLYTTSVSGVCSIATRGTYLLQCNGTVTAGYPVMCDGNNAVANLGSVAGNLAGLRRIGRAVTEGASGGFALVQIQG
jgi:hypothetical protein